MTPLLLRRSTETEKKPRSSSNFCRSVAMLSQGLLSFLFALYCTNKLKGNMGDSCVRFEQHKDNKSLINCILKTKSLLLCLWIYNISLYWHWFTDYSKVNTTVDTIHRNFHHENFFTGFNFSYVMKEWSFLSHRGLKDMEQDSSSMEKRFSYKFLRRVLKCVDSAQEFIAHLGECGAF